MCVGLCGCVTIRREYGIFQIREERGFYKRKFFIRLTVLPTDPSRDTEPLTPIHFTGLGPLEVPSTPPLVSSSEPNWVGVM